MKDMDFTKWYLKKLEILKLIEISLMRYIVYLYIFLFFKGGNYLCLMDINLRKYYQPTWKGRINIAYYITRALYQIHEESVICILDLKNYGI